MEDLTKLSNEELINKFDEALNYYDIDQEMDGSGELGGVIARHWEPTWKAFKAEFNRRDIREYDEYLMPY